ncbi:hypothetical protein OC846_001600 [Tilletia horrida]|uniref:Uncharacterized protein n=1 Tax=Tilletia horrida TaxID=155126 RepID=A0AAN6GSP8_9BASI|nr:hypothetical protein OC846_001600 [Tilletia horrida]KAK0569505.1 hypothetical protein OC861_000878 [Tilletia horrida]
MYRERSSTRHQSNSQSRFDVVTDSPDASPIEPRTTWVGAFERVMGDQAELLNSERRSRSTQPRPSPTPSQTLGTTPSQSSANPAYGRNLKQQLSVTVEDADGRRTGGDKSSSYNLLNLDFGDVMVGSIQDRTIHLTNSSDIPCVWVARLEDSDNMLAVLPLEITDAVTGEPAAVTAVGTEASSAFSTLGPQAEKALRIRLSPTEACRDYEQTISFVNLHNSVNPVRVVVRANMLGNAKNDALAVLSGDSIEFGDCFGGQWTQRIIVIKNLGDVVLEAAFSAQKGAEVVFQLPDPAVSRDDALDTDEFASESGGSPMGDEFFHNPSRIEATSTGETSRRSTSPLAVQHESIPGTDSVKITDGQPISPMEMAETPRNPPGMFMAGAPSELNLSESSSRGQWAHLRLPRPSSRSRAGGTDDESDMDAASLVSQGGSSRPSSPGMQASMYEPNGRQAWPSAPGQSPTAGHGVSCHGTHPSEHGESGAAALRLRNQINSTGPGSDGSIMSGYFASGHESDRGSASGKVAGLAHRGTNTSTPGGFTRHWAAAHLGLRPASSMTRASRAIRDDGDRHEDGTSSLSDATALSQDSRIGPFPASSTYSTGVTSSGRYHRGPHGAPSSGLRPVEQPHSTQVEELFLRPGTEYRVLVSYRPPRAEADENYTAGQLQPTTFSIAIDYARARMGGARVRGGRERKTVTCHLRTCTSFITVEPKFIDFGEVNVGSRKRAIITVTNRSALTTRIDTRVVSKVISMFADEVLVTPQRPYELELQFYPRRVNDKYRKQITIANLSNRSNDQIVEVRAQNVDSEGISLHSMFYSILTPTGANFLDFGDVNINSSRVRTFTIVNISSSRIALELYSNTPEDLVLYVKKEEKAEPQISASVSGQDATGSQITRNGTKEAGAPVQSHPNGKAPVTKVADRNDLKERFLESLATDSTLPARRENKSWRQAQRKAQQGKPGYANANANGDNAPTKAKQPINLLAALKKGGKGRVTVQYGKSIAFKDRTLLRDFEYLDLATGLPFDARRMPPKSKRIHQLDSIEGGTSLRARGSIRSKKADIEVPKGTKDTRTLAQRLIEKNDPSSTDDVSSNNSTVSTNNTKRKPALTAKRKAPDALADPTDLSQFSLDELIAAIESQPDKLSSFYLNNPYAEERHVRTEINLQKELQKAIKNERLQRIDLLQLEPGAERQVVVVLCPNASTRPHIAGNARKQDLRVNFRLMEYDPVVLQNTAFGDANGQDEAIPLPVRELMVRTTLCRSIMELGQAHINLGFMEKGETKARKILIQNRSEWALRYCIKKSGSIVSGDIKLGSGRYGVVPGHGKREVEFVFTPSYIGQLQEKLIIEDIADHDDDQTIQLKAQVRKLPNFSVEPVSLDLGTVSLGTTSDALSFLVTNVTNKTRKFVINIDEADLRFPVGDAGDEVYLDVAVATVLEASRPVLTAAEEEEVEHISQKLKVAHRKGQTDKIQKYEERLTKLGVPIPSITKPEQSTELPEPTSAVSATMSLGGDAIRAPGGVTSPEPTLDDSSSRLQKHGSTATFALDANESLRVLLHVRLLRTTSSRSPDASFVTAPESESARIVPLKDGKDESITVTSSQEPDTDVADEVEEDPSFEFPICLHENKNKDETSTVTVSGVLSSKATSPPASPVTATQAFASRTGVVIFSGATK